MAKAKNTTTNESKGGPASFRLDKILMRKVKYISVVDAAYPSQTEIMETLLTKFVADWEKKNGPIPLK